MKARILISILLISVISLTACININTPGADTGSNSTSETASDTTSTGTSSPTIPTPPSSSNVPSPPTIQIMQFEDRTWVLEKYGKVGNLQNAIAGKEVSARFDSPSGKVSGSAGCNSYSASYQRNINKVIVTNMTSTMMSCPVPTGIMAQESAFKDALLGAESCKIVGNKLEINCTLNRLLIFVPK
ncbi:MAG: META domain-containing protein [Dehalococcoidia bacterium]|nr:META domain-containing protein [Dehalococcoidia bacterium]